MKLLKLITILLILFSGITYAQSDLDNYYSLEQEVAKLRAEFRDNQGLISEHNTTSNHFWSPSSTKKILARIHKDQDRILKEMKPKIEEMKRLEESLEVKAWTYRLGTLEQVSTTLGSVSQRNTCSAQGQQLFTSDKAFEAWNSQNGDLDKKVAYYAEKNGYISNCLANINEGNSADIKYNRKQVCKVVNWGFDRYNGDPVKYKFKKENGLLSISTSIYFEYKGDMANKQDAFKKLRDSKTCIVNFFARHGIKLEVDFKEDPAFKNSCNHRIGLHDNYARPNALNWVTHQAQGVELSDDLRCQVYIHELGHTLGLPDTYPEPDCPDRSPIMPRNDMMYHNGTGEPTSSRKIYNRHIKSMLQPLCEA